MWRLIQRYQHSISQNSDSLPISSFLCYSLLFFHGCLFTLLHETVFLVHKFDKQYAFKLANNANTVIQLTYWPTIWHQYIKAVVTTTIQHRLAVIRCRIAVERHRLEV